MSFDTCVCVCVCVCFSSIAPGYITSTTITTILAQPRHLQLLLPQALLKSCHGKPQENQAFIAGLIKVAMMGFIISLGRLFLGGMTVDGSEICTSWQFYPWFISLYISATFVYIRGVDCIGVLNHQRWRTNMPKPSTKPPNRELTLVLKRLLTHFGKGVGFNGSERPTLRKSHWSNVW